jgi:hypothetical protein
MPRQKLHDENQKAISVRLPENLYDQIQALAQENRRSMNQEIIVLLQKALESQKKSQEKAKR